jgi:hypothetical protein
VISLKPLINLLAQKPQGFDGIWFRQVAGAAEFARIRPEALPLPAAWVVRAADKVQHAGERAENVTLAFDVVIAIENARTHAHGDTDDMLLKYRLAVKDLLLGWEIEADVRPINFAGGQVLEYTDGDLYWRDRYEFDALITNYLPDPTVEFDRLIPPGAGEKP